MILKLDFAKAFDTVEHCAIIHMMNALAFPKKWILWVQLILSTATSSVLLNGVPRKQFHCNRGVGDPLSPLLFILAAELLQYIINKMHALGVLSLPIPQTRGDFPVI